MLHWQRVAAVPTDRLSASAVLTPVERTRYRAADATAYTLTVSPLFASNLTARYVIDVSAPVAPRALPPSASTFVNVNPPTLSPLAELELTVTVFAEVARIVKSVATTV